jgi:hypothetical protein
MLRHAMNKQKGMTMIGWIFLIAIIGFNGLVAINVAPTYFTDSNVKTLWANLETDPTLAGLTPKKLRKAIAKRLKVNNVYDITMDDIEITKEKGFYVVYIEYEPRGKIIGSLDYIMTFSHEAQIPIKK